MNLPNMNITTFRSVLPSTGQEIEYRPYTVGEQKMLYMALEGQNAVEITSAVRKLITSCVITEIDEDKLATFDLEFLFLKIRSKSVGEVIDMKMACTVEGNKFPEGTPCKQKTNVSVNIDDVKIKGDVSTDKKIMLNDEIGIHFHYPTAKDVKGIDVSTDKGLFKIVGRCVDMVFDNDKTYTQFSEDEIDGWIDSLNTEAFSKIKDFFENLPRLHHEIKWKCRGCGGECKVALDGLMSFFR